MASKGAETASESGNGAAGRGSRGRGMTRFAVAVVTRGLEFLRRHGIGLATAVAVLGGLMLLYAETLDLYRILTPSGSVSNATGSVRTGSDQHSWAFAVMGVAGIAAVMLARVTRERLPALAAAMLGVIALVVALAVDLPDVTASGVTTDLEVGDAEPGNGFWVEVAGALVMTAGAAALAFLLARRREPGRTRGGATP
jgi:hypothetical protein